MEFDFRKTGDVLVVHMVGSWDAETRDQLRDATELQSPYSHTIFDFKDVKYIDSNGLGLMLGLSKKIQGEGREVVIVCPSQSVHRVLLLLHVDKAIPIERNLNKAVDRLKGLGNEEPAEA